MTPLTVTWSPHLYTEIGRKNLDRFIRIGGFDHILGSVNCKVYSTCLTLPFTFGRQFPTIYFGQTNFPLKVAVQNDVS